MGIIIRKNDEFTTLLQNKLKERYEQRRRLDNKVTCIRYYSYFLFKKTVLLT